MSATMLVGGVALAAMLVYLVSSSVRLETDAREPPVVYPTIPYIGHIIGLVREGALYIKKLGLQSPHSIMTLPMLNGRMYLNTSPVLASHIQRGSATLSFEKLVADFTPRMVGLSKSGRQKLQSERGGHMVHTVMHDIVHPGLAPGNLKDLVSVHLEYLADKVNALENGQQIELFKFLRTVITFATMGTLYGPENPFALNPSLVDDFWEWEAGLIGYIISPYPALTARAAHCGLENVTKGFREYITAKRYTQAPEVIQKRRQTHEDYGLSVDDQARFEVGAGIAFNINAGITIFWTMNNLFSNPSLLAELREEIEKNALISGNTISFEALRDRCPLLNSVYRETMRLMAPLSSARYVKADTIIADTYLLRKDTVVQIAGTAIHSDPSVWGPDVDTFNARRFYYTQMGTKTSSPDGAITEAKGNSVHPAAYRSFGGGSSLCPGRHFAQMEIISMTALLVTGYDLVAPAGRASVDWNPPKDDKKFPLATTKPVRDVDVRVVKRKGMENIQWVLEVDR